jgi:hypothetical protein
MDNLSFQTVLTILGSTSAFVVVTLVCGFAISLARLTYFQRDVLDQTSATRDRYIINGAAFLLFIALVLVIGLGLLSGILQVGRNDTIGMMLLALPILAQEVGWQSKRLYRWRLLIFVIYLVGGALFFLYSLSWRLGTADWTTFFGVLSNGAFIAIQLIVFAIAWGVISPRGLYQVDVILENGDKISGFWIGQSGEEFLLQVEDAVVVVRAAKVVRRIFRRVHPENEYSKEKTE